MFKVNMNMKEEEQREHPREVLHPVFAQVVADDAGDIFVDDLGHRLQAARDQRAAAHGENQEPRDQHQRQHHIERCVRERDVVAHEIERNDPLDFKLFHRAVVSAFCSQGNPLVLVIIVSD
jgi:hypothetical protein